MSGVDPRQRHVENLQAVYRNLRTPPPPQGPPEPVPDAPHHKVRNTTIGGIGGALAMLASKLKFLGVLAGVLKLKTLVTMALSIGLYATQWGFPFALGFVLLIFVHELGHAIVLKHEGIPFGAPVFIPFVGALVTMHRMPRDAAMEARVAIGGPVLGSLGAWAVLAAGMLLHRPMLLGIAHAGVVLNLFNLLPVPPLDGGRIAGAFTRRYWIVGYALGIATLIVWPSPILFLALLLGAWTLVQRWRHPVPGYHDIPAGQRLAIGLGYAGLAAALIVTLVQVWPAA